jgi:hypothetical protein
VRGAGASACSSRSPARGFAVGAGAGSRSGRRRRRAGRLADVLVTAYRVPTLEREAADNVTIIGREQIERRDVASGVDLFRQVPGLQIDQLGGPGGPGSVYIRGSDPNHVLVLVDGVRTNDPTTSRGGGFDLSNLDPNQIERVEVLRGAASPVYGADAMGFPDDSGGLRLAAIRTLERRQAADTSYSLRARHDLILRRLRRARPPIAPRSHRDAVSSAAQARRAVCPLRLARRPQPASSSRRSCAIGSGPVPCLMNRRSLPSGS